MAALHFIYSTMNAGKSTALLQASHGYRERGLETMVFTSSKDDRYGESEVVSRVGLRSPAHTYSESDNILKMVHDENEKHELSCILIDEAQFLTKDQVKQLGKIVDELKITVMAFGIRTDFQGELFEGSQELLALADNLKELKTICSECDKKATMVVRLDSNGKILLEGEKILIGGNEIYKTLCRKHFRELTKLI